MDFLLPAIVVVFTQIYKWAFGRLEIDKKLFDAIILIAAFMVTFSFVLIKGILTGLGWSVEQIVIDFSIAVTYYQVVVKLLLVPAFNSVVQRLKNN